MKTKHICVCAWVDLSYEKGGKRMKKLSNKIFMTKLFLFLNGTKEEKAKGN